MSIARLYYTIKIYKKVEKDKKRKLYHFSDMIKVSKYWQRDIYNTNFKNKVLNDLFKTFRENMIFYSSDLCGTDFKQVIDFQIRK